MYIEDYNGMVDTILNEKSYYSIDPPSLTHFAYYIPVREYGFTNAHTRSH